MPTKNRPLLGGDTAFQRGSDGNDYLIGGMRMIPTNVQISGTITGSPAGAYRRGPNVNSPGGFLLRGHPSNTSFVSYGTVSGVAGFPMGATDGVFLPIEQLNDIYLVANVAGEVICWSMA